MASLADLEERVKKLEALVAQLSRELPPHRGFEVQPQTARLFPQPMTPIPWDVTA